MLGTSDHDRCQHRHSGGPRRRGGPRPVVEECGPRALRRQGRRTADLPLLRDRHGSARQGAAKPGARTASGDQQWRPGDLLSAGGQHRGRQDQFLRGAVAVAASRTRHDLAGGIHPDRGRQRPDQSARPVGAQYCLRRGRHLAGSRSRRGQRLAGAVQEPVAGVERGGGTRGLRPSRQQAGTRDHRGRAHSR